MTVPVQTPIISYVGNGITTLFAFPFEILQSADLKVLLDGSLQSVGAAYSINGIGNAAGGSVVFNTAPLAGAKVIIYRDISIERDTDYQDNGDLLAATVNADFDRLWMALQDVAGSSARAIQYPITEFALDGTLPVASVRAGNILAFDGNGFQALIPLPASVGAGDLRNEFWKAGTDYVAGTSTSVPLSRPYTTKANLGIVVMAGVPQAPDTYALVGQTLQFLDGNGLPTQIPVYADKIWCVGGTTLSIGAPSTGTVTDDSIAAGSKVFNRCNDTAHLTDFGAVAGADCTVAIAKAEASSYANIFVPAGLWSTTAGSVTKTYFGDGNIVLNSARQAKRVTTVQSLPTQSAAGLLFGGDQKYSSTEYFLMPSTVVPYFFSGPDGFTDPGSNPTYRTNSYFNTELVPHFVDMQAFNGYSGLSTKISATSAAGQKTVNVRNSATITPGMRILIGGSGTGTEELVTVATVPTGTTFTTVLNLAVTHNTGEFVSKGSRTNFNAFRADLDGNGGGDYYSYQGRISLGVDPSKNPDQTHFSYRATAGLIGGDATATADGVYLQFSEFRIEDTNYLGAHDIAAVGDVRSYGRNNDTGAYGNVWIGVLQKSDGTKYCNAAYSVSGKWLSGIDFINADLGVNRAAVKLAPDHRIYFDGSAAADEAGYSLWGANPGDTYINYSSGLSQLQFNVDGQLVASMTSGGFFTGTGKQLSAGGNVSIPQGNRIELKGAGGNTYLTTDGTHVYLITNGGTPKQLD